MKMEIAVAMSVSHLIVIDLGKPIVGGYCAAVGQNKSAYGIGDGRVLLNAPVGDAQILVNRVAIVYHGALNIAELFTLTAVEDVCLCHFRISGLNEHLLNAVLNIFDRNELIFHLGSKISGDL